MSVVLIMELASDSDSRTQVIEGRGEKRAGSHVFDKIKESIVFEFDCSLLSILHLQCKQHSDAYTPSYAWRQ